MKRRNGSGVIRAARGNERNGRLTFRIDEGRFSDEIVAVTTKERLLKIVVRALCDTIAYPVFVTGDHIMQKPFRRHAQRENHQHEAGQELFYGGSVLQKNATMLQIRVFSIKSALLKNLFLILSKC